MRRFKVELSARRGERALGGLALVALEYAEQRAADRGLARRRDDLRAGEVRHIEDVDGALAEGRHVRRGDVEVEARDGVGEIIEQAGPVEPRYLDHRVAVGPDVVDVDLGLD